MQEAPSFVNVANVCFVTFIIQHYRIQGAFLLCKITNLLIYSRKDKYSEITEETDIFSVISRFVHPDDIQKVEAVFSERGLTQIVEENQIVKIEFRTKTRFDTYTWVEGKALYVKTGNLKKILFITYDIESKKQMSLLAKEKNAILDAFINLLRLPIPQMGLVP